MKKVLLFSVVLSFLSVSVLLAQERTVSGKVTSSEDGIALPGVTILLKNTTIGTITDVDGNYKLSVPSGGGTLVFSFVGLVTQEIEIGNQSVIDLAMSTDATQLSEVVITGLGISRKESSLGYSVQQVDGSQLIQVAENNVVNALTGKVAGVQIIGTSSAAVGGSTKIRLRGATTLGEASPLFVVDGTPISNNSIGPDGRTHFSGGRDYGNLASDINPNDIESISVLKGPSAAAIYGQRGANGVILITTKKGSARKGLGIDFNHSTTFDRVYVLPEYQNEYGGGYTQEFSTFSFDPNNHPAEWAAFEGQPLVNYAADESWGPRLDGTPVRHWDSWFPGEEFGQLRPFSANPNNVRDFFETGVTFNNNLSLSGGNEAAMFRLSLGQVHQDGVLPNSELDRTSVSFSGSTKLSDKLQAAVNLNYINTQGLGRPVMGYSGGPVSSFNQWFQRQVDIDRLRDFTNADGTQRFWNIRSSDISAGRIPGQPQYWDNPFWEQFRNFSEDSRDRVFGNVALTYNILDELKITGFLRNDTFVQEIGERVGSGGLNLDSYRNELIKGVETNYEFLAEYNKTFDIISVQATLGGNIRKNTYDRSLQQTVGGLSTPDYYDIAASIDRPTLDTYRTANEVRSLYGTASVGYNEFVYLDFTLRNDWSSTLPEGNNSYLYPSVGGSLVFSELINSSILSFGKARISWAQIGSDIGPFNVFQTFSVGKPYGSSARLFVNDKLQNPELRPQLSSNIEAGFDVRLMNDRLGIDFTYYKNNVEDQILELTVPGSSGYSTAIVNAGEIESKGVELMLTGVPIRKGSFNWEVNLNVARNRSQVISLADGLENRLLQQVLSDRWGGLTLNARAGEEWGFFVGTGFQRFQATDNEGNPIDHVNNGKRVLRSNGTYATETNMDLGSILPDFTGGLRNTFTYKNLNLSVFIDFQKGGQFYSITRMFNAYSGLGAETVGNNDLGNPIRDDVADGGGVRVDGVDENGEDVTTYTDAQTYYTSLFGLSENWLYDASYVKLRELRLGYTLPASITDKTPFRNINFAVIGRNLWLITSNVDGIDPSEIGEGIGGFNAAEGGVLPGVRSLGFNLRLGL
ncbi:MAG: SusC/RagA family TonB-linked outer membrane protein [Bacteroidota bacterium]